MARLNIKNGGKTSARTRNQNNSIEKRTIVGGGQISKRLSAVTLQRSREDLSHHLRTVEVHINGKKENMKRSLAASYVNLNALNRHNRRNGHSKVHLKTNSSYVGRTNILRRPQLYDADFDLNLNILRGPPQLFLNASMSLSQVDNSESGEVSFDHYNKPNLN